MFVIVKLHFRPNSSSSATQSDSVSGSWWPKLVDFVPQNHFPQVVLQNTDWIQIHATLLIFFENHNFSHATYTSLICLYTFLSEYIKICGCHMISLFFSFLLGSHGAFCKVRQTDKRMLEFYSKLGCFEVAKMDGFPKDVIIMGRSLWRNAQRQSKLESTHLKHFWYLHVDKTLVLFILPLNSGSPQDVLWCLDFV